MNAGMLAMQHRSEYWSSKKGANRSEFPMSPHLKRMHARSSAKKRLANENEVNQGFATQPSSYRVPQTDAAAEKWKPKTHAQRQHFEQCQR
jgi:hypothetical protein